MRDGRSIGPWGTAARLCLGAALIVAAFAVSQGGAIELRELLLGLIGLPAAALSTMWALSRWRAEPLRATGASGYVLNIGIGTALLAAPPTRDAALLFYGGSLLLAAARGYAGCEILAVPNALLRRDDELACPALSPVDQIEAAARRTTP